MKLDTIFDILIKANVLCCDWDDKNTDFLEGLKENEEAFTKTLNEEQKKLFYSFRWAFVSHMLSIRDEECMDTFRLGFKFGKEMQMADNKDKN